MPSTIQTYTGDGAARKFSICDMLRLALVIAFATVIMQVAPLFWNRPLFVDWINHVWIVEYYSGYFKEYYNFPTTIDAAQAFGNPVPSSYGVFFLSSLVLVELGNGARFSGANFLRRDFARTDAHVRGYIPIHDQELVYFNSVLGHGEYICLSTHPLLLDVCVN
jgi:hypothetical protein